MQAFGGLFLEKTAEGGLRSASRDWSVVADPDGCISSVTVCMFCRSETATILAAVYGIQFNSFILSKIRGMVSVTAQLIVLTPNNTGGFLNLSGGEYSRKKKKRLLKINK